MCLSRITKRLAVPRRGRGWKVFSKVDKKLHSPMYWFAHKHYDMEQWYEARPTRRYADLPEYPRDFHLFERKQDALEWSKCQPDYVALPVEYEGAHTLGEQNYWRKFSRGRTISWVAKVIVAKRMKILKEVARNVPY